MSFSLLHLLPSDFGLFIFLVLCCEEVASRSMGHESRRRRRSQAPVSANPGSLFRLIVKFFSFLKKKENLGYLEQNCRNFFLPKFVFFWEN